MQRIFFALAAIMTMAASPVLAHTGAGSVSGLAAGFGHPVGGLAIAGVPVPFVELGIVGSIVVLGGVIAAGQRLPLIGAMALVGVLAVFHGHAHGTEMPVNASGLVYGIGFALATAMLHAAGIALGLGLHKMASRLAPLAIRAGGGAIAATGALLFLA